MAWLGSSLIKAWGSHLRLSRICSQHPEVQQNSVVGLRFRILASWHVVVAHSSSGHPHSLSYSFLHHPSKQERHHCMCVSCLHALTLKYDYVHAGVYMSTSVCKVWCHGTQVLKSDPSEHSPWGKVKHLHIRTWINILTNWKILDRPETGNLRILPPSITKHQYYSSEHRIHRDRCAQRDEACPGLLLQWGCHSLSELDTMACLHSFSRQVRGCGSYTNKFRSFGVI